jgi:hypothetical protein
MAQADDTHGPSLDPRDTAAVGVQLCGVAAPFAVAHVLVHAHEFARNRNQQADGLLGDFDRISSRSVADNHAVIDGGFEVHAVDADAGPADDFATFELRNNLACEGNGAMHDDTIGVLAHFDNFLVVGGPPNRHVGVDLG